MPDSRIHVPRIIHTIHATTDIYKCRLLYQDALGGLVFAENYFPAEDRDAALLYVTNHMVEPMAARNPGDMEKPFARLTNKIGQSFHSFEIKVENGAAASQAFRDAGCKVASDYGIFFFVKGESTGGVLLEVCETAMPNDPYDRQGWGPEVGVGHASGVLRLDHIACVTAEIDKALRFFTELVDGEVLADERTELPQPARRAGADRRYQCRLHPAGRHCLRPAGCVPRQGAKRHLRARLADRRRGAGTRPFRQAQAPADGRGVRVFGFRDRSR